MALGTRKSTLEDASSYGLCQWSALISWHQCGNGEYFGKLTSVDEILLIRIHFHAMKLRSIAMKCNSVHFDQKTFALIRKGSL